MALRVKPEKKEERERVAHALLRATLGLAAAHGFSSLGLREVARAADIAPTSFYRHFADMEALGLTLIEDVVQPFVGGWLITAKEARAPGGGAAVAIAERALASAAEDPHLMRFILAERVGAITSFRAALRTKLAALSDGLTQAFAEDLGVEPSSVPAALIQATVAVILEGCAEALEEGPAHVPALLDRVRAELVMLSSGAGAGGRA